MNTRISWVSASTLLFGLAAAGAAGLPAALPPFEVAVHPAGFEAYYIVNYDVDCGGKNATGLPGLAGEITYARNGYQYKLKNGQVLTQQHIRFDVFQGKHQVKVYLSPADNVAHGTVALAPHAGTTCNIKSLSASVQYIDISKANLTDHLDLTILKYFPRLMIREDQFANRSTDVPLEMPPALIKHPDGTTDLIYTMFFSDEDSESRASQLQGHLARYGRTSDIEWITKITFDKDGKVIYAGTQDTAFYGITHGQSQGDHGTLVTNTEGEDGSQHKLLYNIANNNNFKDTPALTWHRQRTEYVAYHIVPYPKLLKSPHAREVFQFTPDGAYINLVSSKECEKECKFPGDLEGYLYIPIEGLLLPNDTWHNTKNGAFELHVQLQDKEGAVGKFTSDNSVDRLGEDLFGKEAIAGLRIGTNWVDELATGKAQASITFKDARALLGELGWFYTTKKLSVEKAFAFRLVWREDLGRYEPIALDMGDFKDEGFGTVLTINPDWKRPQ